jgi:hypothetical protein
MLSDIRAGGIVPDNALPDHANTVRRLSELQGDPLILTLARGIIVRRSRTMHVVVVEGCEAGALQEVSWTT